MRRLFFRNTNGGFTFPEMLVTMLVMGILSLSLANFIVSWLQASTLAQDRANLLNTAEMSMDTLATDVQLSGSADDNNIWPDPNGPGGSYGWQSNGQTLVLAKAAVDGNNNIIFSDPAKYISQKDNEIYYLSGTTLYRRTIVSNSPNDAAVTTCPPAQATSSCPADSPVATGVTSWSVTYYDVNGQIVAPSSARSVQASITLSTKLDAKTISAQYSTRMVFRNE
ncbi:MAG TPA: type II secretion system protein [Candidatus Saccharimonadales bacterium]|nr:type II secretion system protein [Candidatus Saccharimonadales bacterium]